MKSKRIWLIAAVVLLMGISLFAMTSCGSVSQKSYDESVGEGYSPEAAADGDFGRDNLESNNDSGETVTAPSDAVGTSKIRYVIRNGSMSLTVLNTREAIKDVKNIVDAAAGIVSDSYLYEFREGQYSANLTLRVPVNRFDAVMEQLQDLGKATNIQTGDDDVTMDYLDLEARIKNLEAQEARLREILAMAAKVDEVLAVESELSRVRGEIESMTAQFTYLKDQVSFSTIQLNITEEVIATQNISQAPFENLGGRMKAAFVRSINFILSACAVLLVALTAILPVLIVLIPGAAVLWLIITKLISRKPPAA
ncbi:MAG: DUF4349 domain-containing protein [Bacillota bacterium]